MLQDRGAESPAALCGLPFPSQWLLQAAPRPKGRADSKAERILPSKKGRREL